MRRSVILIGGGGHARVLIDALKASGRDIVGYTDKIDQQLPGIAYLGADGAVRRHVATEIELVNAVGSIRIADARRGIFERFHEQGFRFATIIHPSAIIAADCDLAEGAQVMAGAVIQTGSRIGTNSIVNTRAVVDHDCCIGRHVHIAPGAILCGGVLINDAAHVGAGAVVIQGRRVGSQAVIGAGAVVDADVAAGALIIGVPGRPRVGTSL